MIGIVLFSMLAIILIYIMVIYNKFVKLDQLSNEGWSGINVQLKKRYNLIPNLLSTVKGYAGHESEVFEQVTKYRSLGIQAEEIKGQQKAENNLNGALMNLFAVSENYPDLKADSSFLKLQNELSECEDDIEMARRYYNGTVREYNILFNSFPSNIIAVLFSRQKKEFFDIDNSEVKTVPEVNF